MNQGDQQQQHMHLRQQPAAAPIQYDLNRTASVPLPPQILIGDSASEITGAGAGAASTNSNLAYFAPFPSASPSAPSTSPSSSSWSNAAQPGFYTNQAQAQLQSRLGPPTPSSNSSIAAASSSFAFLGNPPASSLVAAPDTSSGRDDAEFLTTTSIPRSALQHDPSRSSYSLEQDGWTSRAPSTFKEASGPANQPRAPVTTTLRKATGASHAAGSSSAKPQGSERHSGPLRPQQQQQQQQQQSQAQQQSQMQMQQQQPIPGPHHHAMMEDEEENHSSRSSPAGLVGDQAGKAQILARGQSSAQASTADDAAATTTFAGESANEAAARKQNTACDACRNRKVRCHRVQGESKCLHCKAKGIDCTTIYVQLASTGAKRPTKRAKQHTGEAEGATTGEDQNLVRYLLLRDAEYGISTSGLSYDSYGNTPPSASSTMLRKSASMTGAPTTAAESRLVNATARADFVSDLIETYFSIVHIRYPIIDADKFRSRFHNHTPELGGPPPDVLVAVILAWGAKFSENPIIVADRLEAANELSATQWQKRQAAAADVGPASERNKVQRRYGETSLKLQDVNSASARNQTRIVGRSRIAQDLIVKAQEVLDRNKTHRHATVDNVKAAIIIQALFWQQADASEDDTTTTQISQLRPKPRRGLYICNGVWIMCAISHLIELRIHLKTTLASIQDEVERAQLAMTWWMVCMMDAHMSAFYRRKPHLDFEDYSCDPPEPPSTPPNAGPSPLAASQQYRIWFDSSQDQVEMMRCVCETLWRPRAQSEGISAKRLEKLMKLACDWRTKHLAIVGAPSPSWPSHWNFADAVTACSSDFNYHIVWILIWEAIDEYGVYELKQRAANSLTNQYPYFGFAINEAASSASMGTRQASNADSIDVELDLAKVEAMVSTVQEEALLASLRAASLTQVLCNNGYLRLEAGILKFSMTEAGYCLSRFRRTEISSIIDGLRQYGQAFEECYEQANELERLASAYMPIRADSGLFGGDETMAETEPPSANTFAGPSTMSNGLGADPYRNAAGAPTTSNPNEGANLRSNNAAYTFFDSHGPSMQPQQPQDWQSHQTYHSVVSAPPAPQFSPPPPTNYYNHPTHHPQMSQMGVRNTHDSSQRFGS